MAKKLTNRKKEKVVGNYLRQNPRCFFSINKNPYKEFETHDPARSRELDLIALKAIEVVKAKRQKRRKTWLSVTSCLMAVAIFMLVTTPGQALAKTVYGSISDLFNGYYIVEHESGDSINANQTDTMVVEVGEEITVKTLEEAKAYMPGIIYVDKEIAQLDEITIAQGEGVTIALSTYSYSGGYFSLQQQVFDDESMVSSLIPSDEDIYTKVVLFNDNIMYSTITPEGNYIGLSTWLGTEFQIVSDTLGSDDLETCISALRAD